MQHGYICIAVLNLKDYPSNVIANGSNIRWNFWPAMTNAKKREFYKAVRGVQKENASVQVNAEYIHSQSMQL